MTLPPRITTQAGREQYRQASTFSQPLPLSRAQGATASVDGEVPQIRATIFRAREEHARLLDDSPALDRFVQAQMEQTGERSYSAALAQFLAVAREVRTLAAQFEDPTIEDSQVARVAAAHARAKDGHVTFAQALRESDRD